MLNTDIKKKEREKRALASARSAGAPIPFGEIAHEEPDFRIDTEAGVLGIEVTELVRPAISNAGIVPVEEENFHKEVIRAGQELYYDAPDPMPCHVAAYFADARGKKRNRQEVSRSLVHVVEENLHRANPCVVLSNGEVPDGFDSIRIISEPMDWWCGECGGINLSQLHDLFASRIGEKDTRLATYRANLPEGTRLWLLLYSDASISRHVEMMHGIEEWRFCFGFDRVFWFDYLLNRVIEIQRSTPPVT